MDNAHIRLAELNAFNEVNKLLAEFGVEEVKLPALNRPETRDLLFFQLLAQVLKAVKAQQPQPEAQAMPEAEAPTRKTRGRKAS